MTFRLQHITPRLPVRDLRSTLQFYQEHLGFEIDLLWPEENPTFCTLARDQVSLSFFMSDEHRTVKSTGGSELYLDTAGVPELFSRLKDKLPIAWGPEVYFYGRREFAILDPDGYMLIFTEKTDDPPTCHND